MKAVVPRASRPPAIGDDPGVAATHHTLPDGQAILLRDVTPADEPLLLGLLERVTGEARRLRFFTGAADIASAAAEEARCGDDAGGRRLGVLALSADRQEVLGHGMCVPAGPGTAEVAFEVADGHHRRGIGTVLFAHLVGAARAAGYDELLAEVLPVNRDMQDLLAASGLEQVVRTADGVRHVRMPLRPAAPDREERS